MPRDPHGPYAASMPALASLAGAPESGTAAQLAGMRQRLVADQIEKMEMERLERAHATENAKAAAAEAEAETERLRQVGERERLVAMLDDQRRDQAHGRGGGNDLTTTMLTMLLEDRKAAAAMLEQRFAALHEEIRGALHRPEPPPPLETFADTWKQLVSARAAMEEVMGPREALPSGNQTEIDLRMLAMRIDADLKVQEIQRQIRRDDWEREVTKQRQELEMAAAARARSEESAWKVPLAKTIQQVAPDFAALAKRGVEGTLRPAPGPAIGGGGGAMIVPEEGPDVFTCFKCGADIAVPPRGQMVQCPNPACQATYGPTGAGPLPEQAAGAMPATRTDPVTLDPTQFVPTPVTLRGRARRSGQTRRR